MKLCNPPLTGYPAPMSRSASPLLLARFRASARLAAWVLLVFMLKIGMVAACTVDEMQDSTGVMTSAAAVAADSVALADRADADAPAAAFSHAAGGCMDCHCHHATALPSVMVTLAGPPAMTRRVLPTIAMPIGVVRNELRPPIL